jgi:hypothetical protein
VTLAPGMALPFEFDILPESATGCCEKLAIQHADAKITISIRTIVCASTVKLKEYDHLYEYNYFTVPIEFIFNRKYY